MNWKTGTNDQKGFLKALCCTTTSFIGLVLDWHTLCYHSKSEEGKSDRHGKEKKERHVFT